MEESKYELKIWLPASFFFMGIGFFTALTPLFIELSRRDLTLDLIAGFALMIGGVFCFTKRNK